jgi:hypothetical protein
MRDCRGSSDFQTHKVYVQNIDDTGIDESLEKTLVHFFEDFGRVVDLKVLRNCIVISYQ